jgi:hypothetical protein
MSYPDDYGRGPISFLTRLAFNPNYRQPQQPPRPPLTPAQITLRRALAGAGVLTACLWLSPVMWRNFGGPLWLSPHDAPVKVWGPLALWAFAALAGLVGLFVGLKEAGSSVAPNWLGAFFAASVLAGIGLLFLKQMFPADPLAGYIVRGLYIAGFAVVAVYFWIAAGFAAASARRAIERELRRRNRPLYPARPRRPSSSR